LAGDRPLCAAISHIAVPLEAEALRQRPAKAFNPVELYVTVFTPLTGAHAGPGLLGVAIHAE